MLHAERAKIFAPFDALDGFDDLIRREAFQASPPAELSQDQLLQLDTVIRTLHPGCQVCVRYYSGAGYETIQDCVRKVDPARRVLTVGTLSLSFDCLYSVEP